MIDDEYGWVTAVSPTTNLLIGYFWRSKDYPWFSAWRNSDEEDGSPSARGLEFGTTGVHQPFPELAAMPTVLGRPTFSFLDAGASHSRAYCMFLCESAGLEEGVQSGERPASSFPLPRFGNLSSKPNRDLLFCALTRRFHALWLFALRGLHICLSVVSVCDAVLCYACAYVSIYAIMQRV